MLLPLFKCCGIFALLFPFKSYPDPQISIWELLLVWVLQFSPFRLRGKVKGLNICEVCRVFLCWAETKRGWGSQYQMTIFSLHDHQQILSQYYFGNLEIFTFWEQTWERDIFSQETLSLGFVGCLRFPSKLPTNRTSETNFTLLPLITIL